MAKFMIIPMNHRIDDFGMMWKEWSFRDQRILNRNPALPLTLLGKQLKLSEAQFLHLCNGKKGS